VCGSFLYGLSNTPENGFIGHRRLVMSKTKSNSRRILTIGPHRMSYWTIAVDAYTAAETTNASQWVRQPQNVPLPVSTPSNTWFLGSRSQYPKRHLDRFRRFCTAHQCGWPTYTQTDRQADRATCDIFSNSRIYAMHARRPKQQNNCVFNNRSWITVDLTVTARPKFFLREKEWK